MGEQKIILWKNNLMGVESFDRAKHGNISQRQKHVKLMHYLVTGDLWRFPMDVKEDVEKAIAELKEKGKKPKRQIIYY